MSAQCLENCNRKGTGGRPSVVGSAAWNSWSRGIREDEVQHNDAANIYAR